MSLDELRAVGGELERERRILTRRLTVLDAVDRGELTEGEEAQRLLAKLEAKQERWAAMSLPARKALLQDAIDRIVVYDDRVETLLRV